MNAIRHTVYFDPAAVLTAADFRLDPEAWLRNEARNARRRERYAAKKAGELK